jgi:uncharacterized Zn finger protein
MDGLVSCIEKAEEGYQATVEGTAEYTVSIFCRNERVTGMDCDCPYAGDGNYCKHMAAVLYELEEPRNAVGSRETQESDTRENDTAEVQRIVSAMSSDEAKKTLIEILEKDDTERSKFLLRHSSGDNKKQSNYVYRLCDDAQKIFYECSDRHGFVDWRHADSFVSRLVCEIVSEVEDMAEGDGAKAAFDVSLYAYDVYATAAVDDDGTSEYLINACTELWETILEKNEDAELEDHILNALSTECEKIGEYEYMAEQISKFTADHFNENRHVRRKLELIDAKIARTEDSDSGFAEYELSRRVSERIDFMRELGSDLTEIDEYRKRYWKLPSVRKGVMKELKKSRKRKELVELLIESKELDRNLIKSCWICMKK